MKSTFRKQIIVTAISMVLGTAAYAGGQKSAEFKEADKNSDGAISFSEAQKALDIDKQQFTQADADNNDQLSSSEYEQIRSGDQAEFAAVEGEKSQSTQGAMSNPSNPGQSSQQSAGTMQGETETDVTAQSRQQEGSDTGMTAGTTQDESRGMSEGSPGAPSTTVPRASDTGTEMASRTAISSELMNKQVDEIKGMEVKNENGDEVGSIDKVVVSTDTNKLYGIVSVGGFLGIGDKHIPIELERLQVRDDELILPTSMTEDELKNTQAYNEENYLELKDDQLLSQVYPQSEGQQMGSTQEGMSEDRFARLDENNDGQISKEEATQGDPMLSEGWSEYDQNKDENIDRTEFSAFEAASEPGSKQGSEQGTKQTY